MDTVKKNIPSEREALGIQILQNCRNELCSIFPFFDAAFAELRYCPEDAAAMIETNGEKLFFSPGKLLSMYRNSPASVKKAYLHTVLHCLFLHPFHENCGDRLWDLACDIAVEQIVEKETKTIKRLQEIPENEQEGQGMDCQLIFGEKIGSAEQLFVSLEEGKILYSLDALKERYRRDGHTAWHRAADEKKRQGICRRWEQILIRVSFDRQEHSKRIGMQRGDQAEDLQDLTKGKYDYRKFLRSFMVQREEIELDQESFDPVFYHLGMEHYGNMPLIEPLEYREVCRLEELVIAIDTSGSCKKETVQHFLDETCSILCAEENFFRKMKVHILQCDCFLQNAVVIHSKEEWMTYSKRVRVQGRSGTDFRPVFRYIREKREKREIRNLKALIYFTDGDGIYPQEKPDYETAFVFLQKTDHMEMVPKWARKLVVDGKAVGAGAYAK